MRAHDTSGRSVLPRTRKTRALLAILALAAPTPVLRTQVCSLLWSQRLKDQARASLRQAVHELQEALGSAASGLFNADRNHLALSAGGLWVDAVVLSRSPSYAGEALQLFQGSVLDDLKGLDPAFDRWLAEQTLRLTRVARTIAENILADQSEHAGVLRAAERLLEIDPTNEPAWRALIRAHAELGDRSAALLAFERCRATLAEAAQTPPGPDTVELAARIRQTTPSPSRPALLRPPIPTTGPAIAVRRAGLRLGIAPLRCLDSGDGAEICIGLADEITDGLARLRWISCVPGWSPSRPAPQAPQPDVDLVLEGTLQRDGSRLRVTTRLRDLRSAGEVVWSRRFDRNLTDKLAIQEEIAAETVAQLDPELLLREGARVETRPKGDPSAHELVLRAVRTIYLLEQEGFRSARDMLERALDLNPGDASAHAWLAYWHLFYVGQGWAADPAGAVARASELAERAVTLDPGDARSVTLAGHVRSFLTKRAQEGCTLHDRAITLNPNLALAWCFSGLTHCYLGNHDEAIRRIATAQRLAPCDPHGFFFDMAMTMPHLLSGQYEKAVEIGRRAIELNPGFSSSYKGHLAALGHLGLHEEAAEVRRRLLAIEPEFRLDNAIDRSPISCPGDLEHYAEGLRRAGLT